MRWEGLTAKRENQLPEVPLAQFLCRITRAQALPGQIPIRQQAASPIQDIAVLLAQHRSTAGHQANTKGVRCQSSSVQCSTQQRLCAHLALRDQVAQLQAQFPVGTPLKHVCVNLLTLNPDLLLQLALGGLNVLCARVQ